MSDGIYTQRSILWRLLVAPFRVRPSAGKLAAFYHQLAALLGAGLPVLRAFRALAEQCTSGRIRRRLPRMREEIEQGGNVADAFARFPSLFDPVDVAMIRAGEHSGGLTETLELLSLSCERRSKLAKKFIAATLYPVFLLHFGLFVIPFVQRLQSATTPYWVLVAQGLGVLYAGLFVLFAVPRVMRQFTPSAFVLDALKSAVPFVAGVAAKLALARFARSLDGLYNSGVHFAAALAEAADGCGNELLRRRVRRMIPFVEQGDPLGSAMRSVGGFPATLVNLVETGEESGQLSEMLTKSADYHADEAEAALNRLVILLGVVIYLGVAAYIGYQIVRTYAGLLSQRFPGRQ